VGARDEGATAGIVLGITDVGGAIDDAGATAGADCAIGSGRCTFGAAS